MYGIRLNVSRSFIIYYGHIIQIYLAPQILSTQEILSEMNFLTMPEISEAQSYDLTSSPSSEEVRLAVFLSPKR